MTFPRAGRVAKSLPDGIKYVREPSLKTVDAFANANCLIPDAGTVSRAAAPEAFGIVLSREIMGLYIFMANDTGTSRPGASL